MVRKQNQRYAEILSNGRTQSPDGGDVVPPADEQRPDHDFRMDGGTTVVWAAAPLQGSNQPGEIELPVVANQRMVGGDKIPQAAGCELEQRRVSPVAVQWLQHPSAPDRSSARHCNPALHFPDTWPGFFNKPSKLLLTRFAAASTTPAGTMAWLSGGPARLRRPGPSIAGGKPPNELTLGLRTAWRRQFSGAGLRSGSPIPMCPRRGLWICPGSGWQ